MPNPPPIPPPAFPLSLPIGPPPPEGTNDVSIAANPATAPEFASTMPPPAQAVIPAPPLPSYTIQQLLAYPIDLPPAPSGISVALLAAKANRPTHNSNSTTTNSVQYDWINPESLRPIPNVHITIFRDRINSMSSVRFAFPMSLPWDASPMMSEASVTGYLDAQVLVAAWQAVLQMLPERREYDVQMVKQAPVEDGIPDQTYSVLTQGDCHILAVLELKSSGVVKRLLPVIENLSRGVRMDLTDDWKAVTRQLRKYAASSTIRDVLVMDDSAGIYFRFPSNPYEVDDGHDCLCACGPGTSGINPSLSLRELVVYVLLCALDRHKVPLRDFANEPATTPLAVGPNTRPYQNVLPSTLPPMDPKKSHGREPSARLQGQRRGNQHASSYQDTFKTWVLGSSVTLEFMPDIAPVRVGTGQPRRLSVDSGFGDGTTRTSPNNSPRKPGPLRSSATGTTEHSTFTTLTVTRIIKKNVALVTGDGARTLVAKLFPPHSDSDPGKWLNKELAVYAECAHLQGSHIPYLHGVCRVVDPVPATGGLVMLTEYIGCGTTVAEMVHQGASRQTLEELHESASEALDCLHRRGVVHSDIAGRNMLVCGNRVVLVDFGQAWVLKGEQGRFRMRREDDLVMLRRVFAVDS